MTEYEVILEKIENIDKRTENIDDKMGEVCERLRSVEEEVTAHTEINKRQRSKQEYLEDRIDSIEDRQSNLFKSGVAYEDDTSKLIEIGKISSKVQIILAIIIGIIVGIVSTMLV